MLSFSSQSKIPQKIFLTYLKRCSLRESKNFVFGENLLSLIGFFKVFRGN